jgi:hypothetical protein
MAKRTRRQRPAGPGTDYDSPWKEALDQELRQVVRQAETSRRVVDKLVKVWRTTGEEAWVLIHVEVQSQEEADFARRMYVSNYRLFDRYNRSVVSLAVLGDDRPGWRPSQFGYSLWGCTIGFQFPVVKLLDYAADEAALEASTNPFAAVVLAHLKTLATQHDRQARRAWKVRLIKGLYERGFRREDVVRLFHLIDWMMVLPEALEKEFWQEIYQFEEEQRVRYVSSVERIGREKGREEGLKEGREEGLKEGVREGLLAGIAAVLRLRFGPEGEQLLPQVRKLRSVPRLQALLAAGETAASLDDLRQLLGKDRGTAG